MKQFQSKLFALAVLLWIAFLSPVYAAEPAVPVDAEPKRLLTLELTASSLQNNLLNESPRKLLYIYLPPAYYSSAKSYPVVYYYNGFGGQTDISRLAAPTLDRLIQAGTIQAFILVCVPGTNSLNGSFLVNSPVTGNWEDFATRDVIQAIDGKFRTLKQASSRGIAGFSMGGFAAVNIGLRHPELFSAVYAYCPGLMAPGGLAKALSDWDTMDNFKAAYGAAFAPNPQLPAPYADIPKLNGTPEDHAVLAKWENGFGNLEAKIAAYLTKQQRLKGFRIVYATRDQYTWIPEGCVYFSKLLNSAGIPHDLIAANWVHRLNFPMFEENMYPFFSQNLSTR